MKVWSETWSQDCVNCGRSRIPRQDVWFVCLCGSGGQRCETDWRQSGTVRTVWSSDHSDRRAVTWGRERAGRPARDCAAHHHWTTPPPPHTYKHTPNIDVQNVFSMEYDFILENYWNRKNCSIFQCFHCHEAITSRVTRGKGKPRLNIPINTRHKLS